MRTILTVFLSVSIYLAISNYGLAGLGLMASGFVGGLWIAYALVEKEKRNCKELYIYGYDKQGNAKYIEKGDE